jgi:hypothetical protein
MLKEGLTSLESETRTTRQGRHTAMFGKHSLEKNIFLFK